jgi:hypothetical protein
MYYMLYKAVYKPVDSKPWITKAMWGVFTAVEEKRGVRMGTSHRYAENFF